MPGFLLPLAMMAGSAISGMLKNKAAKNASKQAMTTTSQNTGTTTSTPTLDPQYKPLQDMILPSITKRLSNPQGLPAGYLENGIQAINESYRDASMGLDNDLTARGLGTSPAAALPTTMMQRGRASDIAKFRNSSAMMGRQMENEDLATALSALQFGRGTTSSTTGGGTTSSTGTGGGGSLLGGALEGLAPALGWLMGSGAFGQSSAMTGPLVNKMNPMSMLQAYR